MRRLGVLVLAVMVVAGCGRGAEPTRTAPTTPPTVEPNLARCDALADDYFFEMRYGTRETRRVVERRMERLGCAEPEEYL